MINFVQFKSIMMDIERNLDKTEEFIKQASDQKADLIVFPELYTTGYNPDTIGHKFSDLAENGRQENSADIKEIGFRNITLTLLQLLLRKPHQGLRITVQL